jgi:hypothetical protein
MSFRIASVTKTFVAAAILRLVETGRFALDTPVEGLLDEQLVGLLRDGGYDPSAITVEQLLTHTSGLLDDAFGPGRDYLARVLADPTRRWARADQVAYAMEGDPVGPPGGQFHYSDTRWVLLGALLDGGSSRIRRRSPGCRPSPPPTRGSGRRRACSGSRSTATPAGATRGSGGSRCNGARRCRARARARSG